MVKKIKKKRQLSFFKTPSNKGIQKYGIARQLCKAGRFNEALDLCQVVVAKWPGFADIHNLLGMIFLQLGRAVDALSSFETAVNLNPRKAEYYYNIGVLHQGEDRILPAIEAFQETTKLQPRHKAALHNLGILYHKIGRCQDALVMLEKSLSVDPSSYLTCHELGNTLFELGEVDKSIVAFERAIELNDKFGDAYAALAAVLYKYCFWDKHAEMHKLLVEMMEQQLAVGQQTSLTPYSCIATIPDPQCNYVVAKSWSNTLSRESERRRGGGSFVGRGNDRHKLNIGYLSNDFRKHPMMDCISGMLSRHDRNKFNVFLYSYGQNDASTERINAEHIVGEFVECFGLSDVEIAGKISSDEVDILIDLAGHTQDNRFGIMALRPAPVQAHYLGFAGTTGADFIDYYIADEVVAPQSEASCYSEKLAYLKGCYFSYSATLAYDENFKRQNFGFSSDKFILASFNNSYKITKDIFTCWMRILKHQDNAVLVILVSGDADQKNLQQAAIDQGVSLLRICFLNKASKAEHLARMRAVDLILDTPVYTGHTTTVEALYVGTPVLATKGSHFASRVSESMLYSVGLDDLVCETPEIYYEKAVFLANNQDQLQKLKDKILKGRELSPLFNVDMFTANMEDSYQRMWQNFLNNRTEMKRM